MKKSAFLIIAFLCLTSLFGQLKKTSSIPVNNKVFKISIDDYNDKVHAIWAGQIIATLMGLPAEHSVASVKWIDHINPELRSRVLDDDWYYEMIAIKGFEKFGPKMTVEQLGEMWKQNKCGSWGSSAEARKLLDKGIKAPLTGHPYYNKFWFTIGPQFSADVYGALSPGIPNLAGNMAREYGHINGYAEGVDGAVFVAAAISLGFVEKDTKIIVRKAAKMLDEKSPYRQCLNMVIEMADSGKSAQDVLNAVEQRWHIEYPNTNNAVANGGIVATCLWFGEADFLKTVNLASRSLDFTDSDCNAANAIGVIMAMKGTAGIPKGLMEQIGDTIKGDKMGKVEFNPAINESISELGKRTAKIGEEIVILNGASKSGNNLLIPMEPILPQKAELFSLADYTKPWDPSWQLVGAGFFGPKGGTYLEESENILITYPRDEVRRLNLNRSLIIEDQKQMIIKVASEIGKPWELIVYANDEKLSNTIIESISETTKWQDVTIDLSIFQGKEVKIRLFQNVLIKGSNKQGGSAYWKNITIL